VATPADRVAIAAICRAAVLVQLSREAEATATLNWILANDENIVTERHTLPYAMYIPAHRIRPKSPAFVFVGCAIIGHRVHEWCPVHPRRLYSDMFCVVTMQAPCCFSLPWRGVCRYDLAGLTTGEERKRYIKRAVALKVRTS
jgi:hypothetical protein